MHAARILIKLRHDFCNLTENCIKTGPRAVNQSILNAIFNPKLQSGSVFRVRAGVRRKVMKFGIIVLVHYIKSADRAAM